MSTVVASACDPRCTLFACALVLTADCVLQLLSAAEQAESSLRALVDNVLELCDAGVVPAGLVVASSGAVEGGAEAGDNGSADDSMLGRLRSRSRTDSEEEKVGGGLPVTWLERMRLEMKEESCSRSTQGSQRQAWFCVLCGEKNVALAPNCTCCDSPRIQGKLRATLTRIEAHAAETAGVACVKYFPNPSHYFSQPCQGKVASHFADGVDRAAGNAPAVLITIEPPACGARCATTAAQDASAS